MPSGPKKRKAVRKKKEREARVDEKENPSSPAANINHHSNGNENNELRRRDEKESDNGDAGSPASRGHRRPFNGESEEPVTNDVSSLGSAAGGYKLAEITVQSQDESSYGNEDAKAVEKLTSKGDSGIGVESVKEVLPQSQVCVKNLENEESNEVLGMETTQVESLVQITDPLLQEVTEVMDSAKSIVQSSEDMNLIEPASAQKALLTQTAQVENSTDSKKSLKSEAISVSEISRASGSDSASMKIGAKVYPVSMDASCPPPVSNKHEAELVQTSDTVIHQANDSLKTTEDTRTEYSEKLPLVAPAPRVAERTSWMNCCGILDLFAGSNR